MGIQIRSIFRAYDFYIFSIVFFVIPNAQLFNMLLRYGPLAVWKQVLAVVLHVIVLHLFFFRRVDGAHGARIVNSMRNFYAFILSAVSFLVLLAVFGGVPMTRAIYGGISVLGFLPFVFYPAIAIRHNKLREMIIWVVATGFFCGVGLIVDYFFNIFGLLASVLRVDVLSLMADYTGFGFRRAMFLFVGPNAIYPFMSLPLFMIASLLCYLKGSLTGIFCFGMVGAISIGLFLTHSRAIWLLFIIYLAIVFSYLLLVAKNKAMNFCVGICAIAGLAGGVLYVVQNAEQGYEIIARFKDFFTTYDGSNAQRYSRWSIGLELFVYRNAWYEYFFGAGIGSTARSISDYFFVHTHYESSIFRAYYEGGYVLLFVKLLPVMMIIRYALRMPRFNRVGFFFLCWVIVYFISICVAPISGDYYNQIAIYMMLGLAYLEAQSQLFLRELRAMGEFGIFNLGHNRRRR
tara:strand:- start:6195 stop:7574 length:1380 start_codon:yes stop_codon:yes gene_type:complete